MLQYTSKCTCKAYHFRREDKDAFYNCKDSFLLKLKYGLIRWQGKDSLYSYKIYDWKGSKNFKIENHVYQFFFFIKENI